VKDAATTTLEKRMWEAADQLRANAGLKSQEYSTPVLGLIFLRFADVRFAAQRAKLAKQSSLLPPRQPGRQARLVPLFQHKCRRQARALALAESYTLHALAELQSPLYAQLVENEWATMELARRVGLPVPDVRRIEITLSGARRELALLVERYDIPNAAALDGQATGSTAYRRGSTGSLSSASTPNMHSCTAR
jgi:hypothetical protein